MRFNKVAMLTAASIYSMSCFGLKLTSKDISENKQLSKTQVANTFGCNGGNVSPELSWTDAPRQTKSYAITVYDPDAPTGSGFWHWIVYDINKSTSSVKNGSSKTKLMPDNSIEAQNDSGSLGYMGACPPSGTHHYIFTVYALNTDKLPVPKDASTAIVRFNIMAHVIDKASITTTYAK